MGTKGNKAADKAAARGGPAPGRPAGRRSATDALREEAERKWAEADRKAARGKKRTQARAKRRDVARQRDAEILRLKGKLSQVQRGGAREAK
ncbi:MAG TPA: hypothetical protein VFB66_06000 [Tepidisphaeraceae bacterium]|nr:hypothetical protein [Tepidisphaeraceae bacterium]